MSLGVDLFGLQFSGQVRYILFILCRFDNFIRLFCNTLFCDFEAFLSCFFGSGILVQLLSLFAVVFLFFVMFPALLLSFVFHIWLVLSF